jgi:hypothetical protein
MHIHLPQRLHLTDFDSLYRHLHNLAQSEPLHLHMDGLRFAEPAGLLPFVFILRNHIAAGGTILIDSFPANLDVCGYLERVGFYKFANCPCPHRPGRRTQNDTFIEIAEIGAPLLSEAIKDKLYSLIEGKVDVKDAVGNSFLTACGELVQNTRHAYNVAVERQASVWPPALIFAQYYEHPNILHFTVADCGVGIRRSLGAKDPEDTFKNERDAIDRALVLGMRGDASGKGLGLAAIRRFMHQNGGKFSIRSGECLSILTPHRRHTKVPAWKGTVVSLEIRGARNIDISSIIEAMV